MHVKCIVLAPGQKLLVIPPSKKTLAFHAQFLGGLLFKCVCPVFCLSIVDYFLTLRILIGCCD